MYPQLSLMSIPVFQVAESFRVGNSLQRETHEKGSETPVLPTQYEISTRRDIRSSEEKSVGEIERDGSSLLMIGCCTLAGAGEAQASTHADQSKRQEESSVD